MRDLVDDRAKIAVHSTGWSLKELQTKVDLRCISRIYVSIHIAGDVLENDGPVRGLHLVNERSVIAIHAIESDRSHPSVSGREHSPYLVNCRLIISSKPTADQRDSVSIVTFYKMNYRIKGAFRIRLGGLRLREITPDARNRLRE